MRRSFGVSIVLIALGAAILLRLGFWQVDRLGEKASILEMIEARIDSVPIELPSDLDRTRDKYTPVRLEGQFVDAALRVLVSHKSEGPVYRYIQTFRTQQGRKILVERGFASADSVRLPKPNPAVIVGHLHWPDEVDMFTPKPQGDGLWYARDADAMAQTLGTEPVMVIAQSLDPADRDFTPWKIDTQEIPNDHLNYAITWFSLAGIWIIMGCAFLVRSHKKSKKSSE